jgi:hypothetical protein
MSRFITRLLLVSFVVLAGCGVDTFDPARQEGASWDDEGKADYLWPWEYERIDFVVMYEGKPLTDFEGCHSEPTKMWDCTRGDGKVSWSSCKGRQQISATFLDALDSRMDRCIQKASAKAGNSKGVTAIHLHDGGGIISNRTARGTSGISQHAWGRAMDIDGVTVYPTKTYYSYANFRSAGLKGNTDHPDYVFFQEMRECWAGLFGELGLYPGTISWDDDTPAGGHQTRMHISYPYLNPLCGGVWE